MLRSLSRLGRPSVLLNSNVSTPACVLLQKRYTHYCRLYSVFKQLLWLVCGWLVAVLLGLDNHCPPPCDFITSIEMYSITKLPFSNSSCCSTVFAIYFPSTNVLINWYKERKNTLNRMRWNMSSKETTVSLVYHGFKIYLDICFALLYLFWNVHQLKHLQIKWARNDWSHT